MIGFFSSGEVMKHSVLLDTSFFIRLLNDEDPMHKNALGYFKYFLENDIVLKVSTISIAEYCVRGKLDDLPLKDLQILPFNTDHAVRTGTFAAILFRANQTATEKLKPRPIVPNDAKLFAQADLDPTVTHFVTSDRRSLKARKWLKEEINLKFDIIDMSISHPAILGL